MNCLRPDYDYRGVQSCTGNVAELIVCSRLSAAIIIMAGADNIAGRVATVQRVSGSTYAVLPGPRPVSVNDSDGCIKTLYRSEMSISISTRRRLRRRSCTGPGKADRQPIAGGKCLISGPYCLPNDWTTIVAIIVGVGPTAVVARSASTAFVPGSSAGNAANNSHSSR
ncbi:hypothetical protein J6590_012444 [Homalodisca vitripennis]|nr:hypothetical protein J6590_012444 [Homalodisca vitripennis]